MMQAIGAEQSGSQPLPATGHESIHLESAKGPSPQGHGTLLCRSLAANNPAPIERSAPVQEEIPLLSREEKRRILAQIVRVNTLDCFDDSGAFDIARAKKILPPGAVRHIIVYETTRVDAEGQPITQRKIHLRLVDPLSALRLDDLLERRGQPRPPAAETSFQALRRRTMAEDDEKARLRMAQAQEDERERRMEAARRARQLEESRQDAAPSQPPDTIEAHAPNVIQAACLFPSSAPALSPLKASENPSAPSPKKSPNCSTATASATTSPPPLSPFPPVKSPFTSHAANMTTSHPPARRPRPPPAQVRFVPPSLCTTKVY